ncbi:hypothetical protein CHS0354_003246 [Potamilus streckersoni]|uniref:Uncharacterized protein n=1 Tax=Potamilus streckersoni TaxID=2493646 RepID=A0AAE0VL64_9BIVA|nr:hypothetical protein CHS0354_003246 [Potamilus streckersoni]
MNYSADTCNTRFIVVFYEATDALSDGIYKNLAHMGTSATKFLKEKFDSDEIKIEDLRQIFFETVKGTKDVLLVYKHGA